MCCISFRRISSNRFPSMIPFKPCADRCAPQWRQKNKAKARGIFYDLVTEWELRSTLIWNRMENTHWRAYVCLSIVILLLYCNAANVCHTKAGSCRCPVGMSRMQPPRVGAFGSNSSTNLFRFCVSKHSHSFAHIRFHATRGGKRPPHCRQRFLSQQQQQEQQPSDTKLDHLREDEHCEPQQ